MMCDVDQYVALSQCFSKRLVWQMGRSGFFSEMNMMIAGMCYALTNHIRFEVDSSAFGCGAYLGWQDYWKPLLPETRSKAFRWINGGGLGNRVKRGIQAGWRQFHPRTLTKDNVWPTLRDDAYNHRSIHWPELGVQGPLIEGYAYFTRMLIEALRDDVLVEIAHQNASLGLPDRYLAMQVRRGDKIEMNDAGAMFIGFEDFLGAIATKADVETVFVVADDADVIGDLSMHAQWKWVHRIEATRTGYRHAEFLDMDPEERRRRIIKLLADFFVCTKVEFFVGTYSSNFSRSVGAFMRDRNCLSLDMPWRNH